MQGLSVRRIERIPVRVHLVRPFASRVSRQVSNRVPEDHVHDLLIVSIQIYNNDRTYLCSGD